LVVSLGEAKSVIRLVDRLFAILLLIAALLCFHRLYLALAGEGVGGTALAGDGSLSAVRIAVFLVGGLACVVGAWRLWNLDADSGEATAAAPLFGRDAVARPERSTWARRLLYALPLIAFVAILADQSTQGPIPDGGTDVVGDGSTAAPDAAMPAPVQTEQAAPEAVAPVEKQAEEAWPQFSPAPDLAEPPRIAAEPAPVETVQQPEPPQTTAPLPKAEPPPPEQAEGHHDAVVWLAVSPDRHFLMSASTDRTIKLWDLDGKRLAKTLGVHKDMARTALFLPDGKRALTAGDDGEIVLRSIEDGAVLHVFSAGENGGANKLALSPGGKRAVSGHDTGTVIVWDIDAGKVLHVLSGHSWSISSVAISPDGGKAVSGSIDGLLNLWDTGEGRLIRTWQGHERGTYGAAFTADGSKLVTGSGDYTIKLWDVASGEQLRQFNGHSGTVYALVLSEDGKRILSCSLDGTARIWDMETGREVAQFVGRSSLYSVAFAPDGSVLTGGKDRAIRTWPAGGGTSKVLFAGARD
jgi:hypothetical protein